LQAADRRFNHFPQSRNVCRHGLSYLKAHAVTPFAEFVQF
jgi:hypothetical protein